MDDYKDYYYKSYPAAKFVNFGDISDRMEVRRRLQCKPFEWYLKNVYPELKLPPGEGGDGEGDNQVGGDQLQDAFEQGGDLCVDSQGSGDGGVVGVAKCVPGSERQAFSFDPQDDGLIRRGELCLTANTLAPGAPLFLTACRPEDAHSQRWTWFRAKRLKLADATLCLDSRRRADLGLVADRCDLNARTQEWRYHRTSKSAGLSS